MWILIILTVVAVLLFLNYNTDKKELHSSVEQKGGMDRIFQAFINYIEDDFKAHRIILNSNTELEISASTHDGKTFYFGIKLGFGDKVIYRCDTKRSSVLNADIAVEGNKSEQVAPYMMIFDELRKKYSFITNAELDNAELGNTELDNTEIDPFQRFSEDYSSNSHTDSATDAVPELNAPIIYSHFNPVYKNIMALSVSNTQCTIVMKNLRKLKFDVVNYYVSDQTGTLIREPEGIDTSKYLLVTGIERIESPEYIHFIIEFNGYTEGEITFTFGDDPTMIEIKYENHMALYYLKENIDHL